MGKMKQQLEKQDKKQPTQRKKHMQENQVEKASTILPAVNQMTQEIDTTQGQHLTTPDEEIKNIEEAAQEDAGFEKILKFRKGEYLIGEEAVPLGSEFLAHITAWTKTWIKFVDGQVADRKLYRVARGEKPVDREDLDDLDKIGLVLDGMSADPWVLQYLIPLENMANGEVVIFVTSSTGGRIAIGDLSQAYTRRAKKGRTGQPIVKLAVTDMPTKKFGKVPRPAFEIVGWDEAAAAIPLVPAQYAEKAAAKNTDMDDAIPF